MSMLLPSALGDWFDRWAARRTLSGRLAERIADEPRVGDLALEIAVWVARDDIERATQIWAEVDSSAATA